MHDVCERSVDLVWMNVRGTASIGTRDAQLGVHTAHDELHIRVRGVKPTGDSPCKSLQYGLLPEMYILHQRNSTIFGPEGGNPTDAHLR
jgi:hypothetical protein